MEMKVSGFDEAIGGLQELANAISPNTMLDWAIKIGQTVEKSCGAGVIAQGYLKPDGQFALDIRAKSGQQVECVLKAIRQHLPSMHPATRAWYEKVIEVYQAKAKAASAHA